MSYDHYQKVDELIEMLLDSSLEQYGYMLQKAMDDGSTGTEIFMALRWSLNKVLSEVLINESIRIKAIKLLEEINKALDH